MHRKRTPHGYGSLEEAIQVDRLSYSCHDGLAAAPSESRATRRMGRKGFKFYLRSVCPDARLECLQFSNHVGPIERELAHLGNLYDASNPPSRQNEFACRMLNL